MKPELHDILMSIGAAYPGRPTISLDEFVRDFMGGLNGRPMKKKTARNRIYSGRFPVRVTNERVLLLDIADWVMQVRRSG